VLGAIRFKIICLTPEGNISPRYLCLCVCIHKHIHMHIDVFILSRCLIILGGYCEIQTQIYSTCQVLVSILDNRQKFEQLFPLNLTYIFFKLPSVI